MASWSEAQITAVGWRGSATNSAATRLASSEKSPDPKRASGSTSPCAASAQATPARRSVSSTLPSGPQR